MFVYEQIGFGHESRCSHLNIESGTVIYQQYSPEGKHEIAYAIPITKSGTETSSSRLLSGLGLKKLTRKSGTKTLPSHFLAHPTSHLNNSLVGHSMCFIFKEHSKYYFCGAQVLLYREYNRV